MNKTTSSLALIIALAAVFALTSPVDVAIAQTNATPDGDGEYKDGEHEGKSCPNKERKSQSTEYS